MEKGDTAFQPQVKTTEVVGTKDIMKSCTSKNKLDTFDEYAAVGFGQIYSDRKTFHTFNWTKPFTDADGKVFVEPGK